MPTVEIGARTIEYHVRESGRATRKRIEVTPGSVEVIVPEGSSPKDVRLFVDSRRRWLHNKTEEIREEVEKLRAETPQGFHSGAKVLFRGRYLKLRVESTDADEPRMTYRTAFHVQLPAALPEDRRGLVVQELLEGWLETRLHEDAWEVTRRRGWPNGLEPEGIRIKHQRTLWGSCGRDRVIRLDRKLARVPKPVFEYVVVHELCHLKQRDHSDAFWSLLQRVLPDYRERKAWLEEHEVKLG